MMCVSAGKSVGEIAWKRCDGIGSRGHVVGWLERRSLESSASVRGQKRGVLAVDVVGLRSCVCGAGNWLLIDLVLFVKKVAKSSAVKEVVVEGDRGELNVLKRLRVSDVLLILLCMKYCLVCQCGLHQRKMKAKTDRYSGLTDLLICAIFSLLP